MVIFSPEIRNELRFANTVPVHTGNVYDYPALRGTTTNSPGSICGRLNDLTILIISPLTVLCFLTLASLIKTMKEGMHRLCKFCEDEHLEVKNIPIGTVQQDVMGSHVILIDKYPFTFIPRGVSFKFMPPPIM